MVRPPFFASGVSAASDHRTAARRMAQAEFSAGQKLFYLSADRGYTPVVVKDCRGFGPDAHLSVAPLAGGSAFSLSKEERASVVEADEKALAGAPDMVQFLNLTEPALLHSLRVRYARDEIYTRAGSILISVNPFKQLGIYTKEQMKLANVSLRRPARRLASGRRPTPASPPAPHPSRAGRRCQVAAGASAARLRAG